MNYELFDVTVANHVAHVVLNRGEKANALHQQAWDEMEALFNELDETPAVRVIVLSAAGKHFCAGIDLNLLMEMQQQIADDCDGRLREKLRQSVFRFQAPVNAIDNCRKPVLAAVHSGCVGAGVDIITACDMRYATEDAFFAIAEIDVGMVADVGTLQRLPKIIPAGMAREMAYTGRRVYGPEAKTVGLLNQTFATKEEMLTGVMAIAQTIAAKSPLSIRGTKNMLNYMRDHSVADGHDYIATWNAAMLFSNDLMEAMQARMLKRDPEFKN